MPQAVAANLDVHRPCVTKSTTRCFKIEMHDIKLHISSLLQPQVLAEDFSRLLTTPLRKKGYPRGLVHQIIKVLLKLGSNYIFFLSHNIFKGPIKQCRIMIISG